VEKAYELHKSKIDRGKEEKKKLTCFLPRVEEKHCFSCLHRVTGQKREEGGKRGGGGREHNGVLGGKGTVGHAAQKNATQGKGKGEGKTECEDGEIRIAEGGGAARELVLYQGSTVLRKKGEIAAEEEQMTDSEEKERDQFTFRTPVFPGKRQREKESASPSRRPFA